MINDSLYSVDCELSFEGLGKINFQPIFRKSHRFLKLGALVYDAGSKRLPSKDQVFTMTAFIWEKLLVKLTPEGLP